MASKLHDWVQEQIEQEVMNQMWSEFSNKIDILKAEAFEEIQKEAVVQADKIMKTIKLKLKTAPSQGE